MRREGDQWAAILERRSGKIRRIALFARYFLGMKRWRGIIGIGCAIGLAITSNSAGMADETADEQEQPIAAVQALLKRERLYSGTVDGVAGERTVAAIRRYQILHGLRATGRLDPSTLRIMLLPRQPSSELSASDQQLLRELAQTAIPDPVAETRRTPIPPGEPPAVSPADQKNKDANGKKTRARAAKSRRSAATRSSD